MRTDRLFVVLVAGVTWLWPVSSWAQGLEKLAAASVAPAWSLPVWTSQGAAAKNLSSVQLQGRWVYLDFWASWCGPCKQSFPWMGQLQNQLKDQNLLVVAVGLDKQAQPMEQFLRQYPVDVQVVWDPLGATARRFEVQAMPSSYLINPAGQVVWRHRGFQPANGDALLQVIRNQVTPP